LDNRELGWLEKDSYFIVSLFVIVVWNFVERNCKSIGNSLIQNFFLIDQYLGGSIQARKILAVLESNPDRTG
jgi:hypothetical protein